MYQTKIAGVGMYVPDRIVKNEELASMIDTTNEWIVERTGIEQRRWFKPGVDSTSSMGTRAAEIAIEKAGLEKQDIDFVVFATLSPDYIFPGSGVLVQEQLGLDTVGALDVRNQCSGFIYGLSIADQFIKTGQYQNILLVCSEVQSNTFDLTDEGRSMAVIFGDGAGALVLSRSEDESQILSTHLHSEGKYAKELILEEPSTLEEKRIMPDLMQRAGRWPYMNGRNVFKHAITRMSESINEALEASDLNKEDIDLLIAHQANLRIAQGVQKKFGLSDDRVFNNIQKYGNTTAASIPIALFEALEQGRFKRGDVLCFTAFGSGFTWASALLKY